MSGIEVSVIVPIYNVADYLDKCISSILKQTYETLQIILVDDGSTDRSSQICDYYAHLDSRIIVHHKQNGGLVSARKAGLKMATGEYIGYVDGDDWIEEDFYEHLVNYIVQNNVDMVETEHYEDAGVESKRIKSRLPYGKYAAQDVIPFMLCDDDFNECRIQPYLWSKLFKKSLLVEQQARVDERIRCGEDIAVTYPYILKANNIFLADYAGYHYLQRQDSMTSLSKRDEQENDRALIHYLKIIFEENKNYSKIMIKQLNQYTKSMLLLRHIDFFDKDFESKKLIPFGEIDNRCRIALYGAGRMGKSLYQYFKIIYANSNVLWGDKEFAFYQQLGLPIISPEEIVKRQEEYDKLLIAVSSKGLAQVIQNFLTEKGVKKDKLVWLTEEFVDADFNVLSAFLEGDQL